MADSQRLTMTIPEFAKLADLSRNQAYTLAAQDKLGVPILKFGKCLRLPRQAALQLLRGDTEG